ncbi:MAG TPA: class I SAM-dependent methyltransferase [Candidatus Limnocylindria bacterium]|nr:class I SAM-dependent methyltransferase [Candidatus Limnocylindria bacterium]
MTLDNPPLSLNPVQRRFRGALLEKLSTGEFEYERAETCLCGATAAVELAPCDRFGIPVRAVLCPDCGLCRTDPRLATKDLPSFYNQIYHGLHQGVAEPDPSTTLFRRAQGAAIHAYVHDLLPAGRLRVAEIGCGTGTVLREFRAAAADREVEVAGCEYSEAFVAAGREAGTDVRLGGPEALRGSAPFDLVIMSHVAEHFPHPVRSLREIGELGHPGTLYYVEVPGLLTIHRKVEYGFRLDRYLTLAHTYHFSRATLTATMARAGFAVIRADEQVRSVFRTAPTAVTGADPAAAVEILDYLRWLDGAWRMRMIRARRSARLFAGRMARTLLGPRLYALARRQRRV